MDGKHLRQAEYQFARAEAAIVPIQQAKTLADMENAWGDFLLAVGTFFNKLHAGAKTAGGSSYSWFGRKLHQRKTDDLLRYVYHSRDAHEHGIVELKGMKSLGLRSTHKGPATFNILFNGGDIESAIRQAATSSGGTSTFVGEPIFMCDTARNKKNNTTCNPPNLDGGFRARLPTPEKIATLTLERLRVILKEAQELPPSPPTA